MSHDTLLVLADTGPNGDAQLVCDHDRARRSLEDPGTLSLVEQAIKLIARPLEVLAGSPVRLEWYPAPNGWDAEQIRHLRTELEAMGLTITEVIELEPIQ